VTIENQSLPLVTVVMPIRNEAKAITSSLSAVLAQDYPADRMEVIVADGMSTDGTRGIVRSFQNKYLNVHLADNPEEIVSTGLNAAIAKARGEFCIRVDGHTVVADDYVRECVSTLRRTNADNVGGRMDAVGQGLFGQAVALATSSRFGVGGARFHYSDREEWVDTVYMGAWPRSLFRCIGLFDEEMVRNQDDELNYRLRSQGGKILFNPRIKSHYYNRTTPRSLWRQYFQYGYWKVRVMQKHRRQMRPRHFVPPLFVTTLSVALLLALFLTWGIWALRMIICAYASANLAASLLAARKRGLGSLLLLPVAFTILHMSYGCGFLMGLVRFWNRWRDRENRYRRIAGAEGVGA
jgi:succinoglycan biosynthesis protein ExoA